MYRNFFNMANDPFAIHPSPDNYFESLSHGKAERLLVESVKDGEPNILITGEYGVGKTLLCLKLCRFLETKPEILAVTVCTPAAPYSQLLRSIAVQLRVSEITDSYKTVEEFESVLFNLYSSGKIRISVYIVIDDLQDFEQQLLLRCVYLANFHVKDFYPFRLICFSHPRFIDELGKNSKFVSFLQRFRRRLNIQPLQEDELKEYVYFRLLQAGAKGRPIFNDESLRCIADISGRIPRLINNLCDRVLLKAVELGVDRIDLDLVRKVCHREEIEGKPDVREGKKKKGVKINLDAIAINNGNDQEINDETSLPRLWITRRHLKMSGIIIGVFVLLLSVILLWESPLNSYERSLPEDGKSDHQALGGRNGSEDSLVSAAVATNGHKESGNQRGPIGNQVQDVSTGEEISDQRIMIRQLTIDDLSDSTTESKVLPGETPYTLEVFSSSKPADIETELKRLRDKGFAPLFISEAGSDRVVTRWSICLGSFASRDDAQKSTWFSKVPGTKVCFLPYTLLLSLTAKAEDSDGLRKTLEVDGYHPWLERLENGQYRLLMGIYPTRKAANLRVRELQEEGITAVVVKK